jgi:hypothetical protein
METTMKDLLKMFFVALGVLACSSSYAQFGGLKKLSGLGGGDQASSQGSGSLVTGFVESYQDVIQAQIYFATAFDLQDQVALLEAEQKSLSSGQIDGEGLEKVKSTSESVDKAILERMETQPELSEEGRESYTQGLFAYFSGLLGAKGVVDSAQNTGMSLGGNPLSSLRGASSAAYVAKELPSYFSGLQSTGKMMLEYGGRNNIEAPSNATSLLDSL